MIKKQKLELTWIGKENRPKLEPRILLKHAAKSYHAKHRVTGHHQFDNRFVFGHNLLPLKALEDEFAGELKRTIIDRPSNTISLEGAKRRSAQQIQALDQIIPPDQRPLFRCN